MNNQEQKAANRAINSNGASSQMSYLEQLARAVIKAWEQGKAQERSRAVIAGKRAKQLGRDQQAIRSTGTGEKAASRVRRG